MKRLTFAVLLLAGLGCEPGAPPPVSQKQATVKLEYPKPPRSDQVDDYHGTQVADPYRPLEDVDSPETRAWIEAENKLTFSYLEKIPTREPLHKRLTALWNYERFGVPVARGSRYFFTKNDGLQNQAVLYVQEGLEGEPRVLLDPNALSAEGTTALVNWEPSPDGRWVAYALAEAGSDWQTWHIRDVDSLADREDVLRWVKFSGVSWIPDASALYYSRYDEPPPGEAMAGTNYFQKLFRHVVGQDQAQDVLVYERADEKEWGFDGHVTDDGHYLVITVWRGTEEKHCIFYLDLTAADAKVVELLPGFEAEYEFVDAAGSTFYVRTDRDAPRGRMVAIDLMNPHPGAWKEIVPQPDAELERRKVLRQVKRAGNLFLALYLDDAHSVLEAFSLDAERVSRVELPTLGTVTMGPGRGDDREAFYSFTSFTYPPTLFRFDLEARESRVFRAPKVSFDPADYRVEQVRYDSADGTSVPMFLCYRNDVEPRKQPPALLYGYGGFNIALTPTFSVPNLVWLELGGLYAMPNLRGGGEFGRPWHEAGQRFAKQRVFDDFIGAAQYLVGNQYASTRRLAISGRSNGGLLVGACLTQAPYLFGAALPGVGVMDMLRFHKFTIGWAWVSEYGSSDDAQDFANLRGYSPLHNIRAGAAYPPTLITTADHDDRVVPGHSFKFAAALQAAQGGTAPILLRVETSAGHGAGTPTTKQISEAADALAFLTKVFDMPVAERPGEKVDKQAP